MCACNDGSLAIHFPISNCAGNRPRILIADSHLLVAEALKGLLEPEFNVVGIVTNGRMLIESLHEFLPAVVILEVSLPHLNGLDAGENIKAQSRRVKLIYLTAASSADIAAEAFRRGASGYVLKNDGAEEMRRAIHRVILGRSYVSPHLNKEEIERHLRWNKDDPSTRKLTTRQCEIMQLIAEGRSMKEIGYMVKIKPNYGGARDYEDS